VPLRLQLVVTIEKFHKLLRLPLGLTQEFIVYHPANFIILHQVIGTVAQLCLQINNRYRRLDRTNLTDFYFIFQASSTISGILPAHHAT
jgi:hypothetical protein